MYVGVSSDLVVKKPYLSILTKEKNKKVDTFDHTKIM